MNTKGNKKQQSESTGKKQASLLKISIGKNIEAYHTKLKFHLIIC